MTRRPSHALFPHDTSVLNESERDNWLRLARAPGIGAGTCRELFKTFSSVEEVLDALPGMAVRGGRKTYTIPSDEAIEAEKEAVEKANARLIFLPEPTYPALLRHIYDPPPAITVKGDMRVLERQCIALVGSRNGSIAGKQVARTFASELGARDFTTVSGLARGIDTAVHRASLAVGTIACLAGGIDRIYPHQNLKLAEQITQTGLLLTESPMGRPPHARLFPARNRLISGLSVAVIVIEAKTRSGSLITARTALEQGREIMAVPGSPLEPRSDGCNRLIQDGAHLVRNIEDILEALQHHHFQLHGPQTYGAEDEQTVPVMAGWEISQHERERIAQCLSLALISIDDIGQETDIPIGVIQTVLLEMEVAGRLIREQGNRVALLPTA
ncbi:MAG: DNA-processing protein DprA [Pseudomonadota bacterium]